MRVTEAEDHDLTFHFHTVTDTDQLLLDRVTFRDTYDHIVDQGTIETVHRTVARLICRTFHCKNTPVCGNFDVRINLLGQRSERAFHRDDVVVAHRDGDTRGQVYR